MNLTRDTRNAGHLTGDADGARGLAGGLLQRWIDGDVSPSERARIAAHLGECGDCAREARVYRMLFRSLERLPRHAPPADLAARITSRALAQRRALLRRRWLSAAGWGYAGASVTLLLGLGMSPWREDALAGVRTFVSAGLSGLVTSFLGAVDRLFWVLDHVIRLQDQAHAVADVMAPLVRSFQLVAAQPEMRLGATLALVLTTALWWFLRHRSSHGEGRMSDVAFL
jgi:anti-sigma factor RsiW